MRAGTGEGDWPFYPPVLVGAALVAAGYRYCPTGGRHQLPWSRPLTVGQIGALLGGLALIPIALRSPLDGLTGKFLFSVHMAKQLLTYLVAPPLLLYGTRRWMVRPAFARWPLLLTILRGVTQPALAFVLYSVAFVAYHLPVVDDATLESEPIHGVVQLLLISTGIIGWWPVRGVPPEAPRLPYRA